MALVSKPSVVSLPTPYLCRFVQYALVVACLLTAKTSAASSLPRLVVHRAPQAQDCPDAVQLATSVHQIMQRQALDPTGNDRFAPLYEVEIVHTDAGYTAIIRAGGLGRQISDSGVACNELAEALALTLAILLDSDVPPLTPSPPPLSSPVPSRQPSKLLPKPLERTWNTSFALGAAQTTGLLIPFSTALFAEVSLRLKAGSLGAGITWVPSRTIDFSPGTVNIGLTVAMIRGCTAVVGPLDAVRLSLCAQPFLGVISGEGTGYEPNRKVSAPWFAFGGGMLLEGTLVGPLGWSIQGLGVIPITLHNFTVDRRVGAAIQPSVVFESSPVGLLVGGALRATIP